MPFFYPKKSERFRCWVSVRTQTVVDDRLEHLGRFLFLQEAVRAPSMDVCMLPGLSWIITFVTKGGQCPRFRACGKYRENPTA